MRIDRLTVMAGWVVLSIAACSDETGGPFPDSGSGMCGPAVCPGCCQGNTCIDPPSSGACGTAGFPCVVCGPGETCQNGQCVSSSTCGPATCGQGCCKGNQCLAGNTDVACGSGGSICLDCAASGGTCQAGSCQGGQACNAKSCPGCCLNNQCFNGGDNNRCGASGATCVDCTESSKSCDPQSGSCIVGPPPTCDATTCAQGCCDGNKCLPGNTNADCGKGGAACVDCTNLGKSCDQTTRLCTAPPPSCGPGNCSGCCHNNQCLSGASDGACGQGGVPCQDCGASGKVCDAGSGTCTSPQPSCGPGSCAGCCQGTQCLSGGSDGACGLGGIPCQDCAASGGTCESWSGQCTAPPSCGPGSCSGCCDGATCMPGSSKSACGWGGAPCDSCSQPYETCSLGACAVDPSSKWEMVVVGASINQALVWDPWLFGDSKKPDPYFGVDWDTCSRYSIDSPCSSTEDNTYDPSWYHQLGTFPASDITGGWCAFVGDADGVASCTPPFETIALCPVKVYDSDLQAGSKVLTSCPHPDDGVSYITYLEFKFTYAP